VVQKKHHTIIITTTLNNERPSKTQSRETTSGNWFYNMRVRIYYFIKMEREAGPCHQVTENSAPAE
jgi:hypothetical protein